MLDSKKVRLVALTATASRSSRESIVRSLRMHKPSLVYVPPMKKNIFYVVQPKVSIESLVCKLVAALREFRTSMPRIIWENIKQLPDKVTQRNLQAKHAWVEQHQPAWNNIAILDHASNINTLRVKEALHISQARRTTKQRSRDSYCGLLETIAETENW